MEKNAFTAPGLGPVFLNSRAFSVTVFGYREKGMLIGQDLHSHNLRIRVNPHPPDTHGAPSRIPDIILVKTDHLAAFGSQENIHIAVRDSCGNQFVPFS